MLVLTRKQRETIQIGEDIAITVLRTKGNSVRLGIEAPASVAVRRGELPVAGAQGRGHTARATGNGSATIAAGGVAESAGRSPASDHPRDNRHGGVPGGAVLSGRVPHSRVDSVLPALLGSPLRGGGGPLRSMLERRGERRPA